MIQGVVFDFNGTLFFDAEYHLAVFDRLKMELTGEHMDMAEMEQTCAGVPNTEIFQRLSKVKLTREECEAYSRRKEEIYRNIVRNIQGGARLCPGTEAMFSLLQKRKIPFTIASASIKENIDFFVKIFHLDQWMDPDQIVYDNGSYTNKTAMFEEAFRRLNVREGRLVFEDSLSGVRCGSEAGAKIIAIDNPNLHDTFASNPDVIALVHNMKEAIPIVLKNL